ncbi:MAG: protein TolR [Bdellovibrionales bacterium]|nr:protein TolR [Bdellovibrionales bacterium]
MGMTTTPSKSRTVLSEINVTPLVDVMLVLLIIFMVTAPMMNQGIDVDLPETRASGVDASQEPMTLVIRKNNKIFLSEAPITLNGLGKKLAAIMETRKNKQIYIQADRQVAYGFVAEIMGEIRAAGIHSIGLITIPKAK